MLSAPSTTRVEPATLPVAVYAEAIDGGYQHITAHQLVLAWWLYRSGQMTRRQLRIVFAAHEMVARRNAAGAEAGVRYTDDELVSLVGGRGSEKSKAEIGADVRALDRLGIVKIGRKQIVFATSVEQVACKNIADFWELHSKFTNDRRRVPVPRRMLRALAAGFGRSTMAYIIAMLLRSLYWHKASRSYRVDGRTKGSWIAETFCISRRAVSDARAQLLDIGWLRVVNAKQWELNRWGAHDAVEPTWRSSGTGKVATLESKNSGETAIPCTNRSPSPSEKIKNRIFQNGVDKVSKNASLRCVTPENLACTPDLLLLYRDATKRGWVDGSEAGELAFFAYAERARAHGRRPGALFSWLVQGRRTEYITQADEDAAVSRKREYHQSQMAPIPAPVTKPIDEPLSEDEHFYLLCITVARQHRVSDPFQVAMHGKRWTRQQWEEVKSRYISRLPKTPERNRSDMIQEMATRLGVPIE